MYMYKRLILLYSRNSHNIVNQLYSNKKIKKIKTIQLRRKKETIEITQDFSKSGGGQFHNA